MCIFVRWFLLFPSVYWSERPLFSSTDILWGQGDIKTQRDYNSKKPRAKVCTQTHHSLLWLENKPCTHTHPKWESCKDLAPSYNIISFECFFCASSGKSAITIPLFSILPSEKGDNIYVTWQNVPDPLCIVRIFSITVDAEGRRWMMP